MLVFTTVLRLATGVEECVEMDAEGNILSNRKKEDTAAIADTPARQGKEA